MRISDWSSDVCSSDLALRLQLLQQGLELDAVVALDVEGARDLALADRLGALVDEREHLFLAGEGRGAGLVHFLGAGRILLAGQGQSAAGSSAVAFFGAACLAAAFLAGAFLAAAFLAEAFFAVAFFAEAFLAGAFLPPLLL